MRYMIWGSCCYKPKAIFYLLTGDYRLQDLGCRAKGCLGLGVQDVDFRALALLCLILLQGSCRGRDTVNTVSGCLTSIGQEVLLKLCFFLRHAKYNKGPYHHRGPKRDRH